MIAMRNYAQGDSHRLIHWKASARKRQLLIRQFSSQNSDACSLWLRTDAAVWTRPEQFELLLSFAATLAQDLFRSGRLLSTAIDGAPQVSVRRLADVDSFLDRLAEVVPLPEEAGRLPASPSRRAAPDSTSSPSSPTAPAASRPMSMEARPQRLSLEELHLLRWLLGGSLMLVSVATVFYMDIGSELFAAAASLAILAALARPALPSRVPVWVHRLAFPAILAFFAGDLWRSGQLLPAIVRLDLLLLLYRGISYRARRDDLQIVVLGLFLVVVAGVLTVSLLFAGQILVFTAGALGLLMVVTIADSTEGGAAPKLAVRGVLPGWAARAGWGRLARRLWEISDWRLLASACGLFVGVVAISGLLFLAIPRFQLENSLFLERFVTKRAMTGFNDSIKFGDITEITQDDSVAFDVDLSDPAQVALTAIPMEDDRPRQLRRTGGFEALAGAAPRLRPRAARRHVFPGFGGVRGAPTWTFYLESGVSKYLPVLGRFGALRFREAQNYRYSPDLAVMSLRDEPASMTAYRVVGMAPEAGELRDLAFAGGAGRPAVPQDSAPGRPAGALQLRQGGGPRASTRRGGLTARTSSAPRNSPESDDRAPQGHAPLLALAPHPERRGRPARALDGVPRVRPLRALRRLVRPHGAHRGLPGPRRDGLQGGHLERVLGQLHDPQLGRPRLGGDLRRTRRRRPGSREDPPGGRRRHRRGRREG